MNQVLKQSKVDHSDESDSSEGEKPKSYYYDDATNYETYRDDDEDDDEASPQNDAEN